MCGLFSPFCCQEQCCCEHACTYHFDLWVNFSNTASRTSWSQDLLKVIEDSKELLCICIVSTYIILEIITKTLHIFIIKIIIINLFMLTVNSIFLLKNTFPEKHLVRRVALFYIFANFFNVWLKRRQLDSHLCCCIQSIVTCCFGWGI